MSGELKIIQPIKQVDGVGMTVVVQIDGKLRAMAADKIELMEDGSLEGSGFPVLGVGKVIVQFDQEEAKFLLKRDGRHELMGAGNGSKKNNPRRVWVEKTLSGGE